MQAGEEVREWKYDGVFPLRLPSQGSKRAIVTSPCGAERRAPASKFLLSLSQVGLVLTAQHSWLPSGLAWVCFRVKNPQEFLN